jgi:predicted metal-binding transcription factor (methanogenesis marker protein 9)
LRGGVESSLKDVIAMSNFDYERLKEALAELEREHSIRKRAYGKWMKEGRLTEEKARKQLEALEYAIEFIRDALKVR